ncbi:tRNA (guanine-N(7)-)-methyltransferase non-catalytic subunit wdr4 [Copidosoma floridanum]|uniref:tRNA (guanine-N(7)-)-methyltransferase non-catalytic subunit wdr4 n=1 Tax=Copidosoma floridanum TaxID=29053 RepID=UPI000C6F9136|nr:tRNA (guanine-N(7)-)-methyltransferase non-catalytic subunit wdr4 [Copidosoma floridanum]
MSFSIHGRTVALCSGDSVVIYNLDSKIDRVVSLPKLELEKEIKDHNREEIESFHTLTYIEFSKDGRYFLVCTNRKQLCLYKTETCELVSNRAMVRAVSRVRFMPSNDIVVADKSGDAYMFSASKPSEKGELLLGHLSMLLDVLVTDDKKLVITADRDEKIRVSMYPNSYNIVSYCLGHKNFVTNVAIVPHDKNLLVSSGGDGTLMFWDFKRGKELLTVYFHEKLSQNDLIKLNKTLKENDLEDQVTVSPVKHIKLLQVTNDSSIIAVTFYCTNVILVYGIYCSESNLSVEYLDLITVQSEPMEIDCHKNQLWVLTDSKIFIFEFISQKFVSNDNLNDEIEKLNDLWKKVHNGSTRTLLPILYKRKYNNVQEYKERKKLRLINNTK